MVSTAIAPGAMYNERLKDKHFPPHPQTKDGPVTSRTARRTLMYLAGVDLCTIL